MITKRIVGRWNTTRTKTLNRALLYSSRRPGFRPPALAWLFVATLPNSGSTALTKFLESAPDVHTLRDNGEGQMLLPQMRTNRRWDPRMPLDYDLVRAVWLHHAVKRSSGTGLIVEKSPPNIMRATRLMDTFKDFDPSLLIFTRDPLAVCASWAKRYPPDRMLAMWYPDGTPPFADEESYFIELGRLYGQRTEVLRGLVSAASLTISYEELTESPDDVMHRVTQWCPRLSGVDTRGLVSGVKDYAPQPLRNMNAEQVATLDARKVRLIKQGLDPYSDALAAFDYAV